MNRTSVLRASTSAPPAISKAANWPPAACRRARNWNSRAVQGQASAGAVHPGIQAAGLRQAAESFREGLCARPPGCSRRPAGRAATASWSTKRRASSSRSRSSATTRATNASPGPTSRACEARVDASLRIVDTSQYVNRVQHFRFRHACDHRAGQSQSPGNEQRDFWSTRKAADTPGSRNLCRHQGPGRRCAGRQASSSPPTARTSSPRRTRWTACFCGTSTYVPQYHNPWSGSAYWNKFGMPEKQPSLFGVDTESWWIDPEKEKPRWPPSYKGCELRSARMARPRRSFLPRLPGARRCGVATAFLPGKRFAATPTGTAAARAVGLRRPEIPGRTSSISTT
jgi:hypothetical protein